MNNLVVARERLADGYGMRQREIIYSDSKLELRHCNISRNPARHFLVALQQIGVVRFEQLSVFQCSLGDAEIKVLASTLQTHADKLSSIEIQAILHDAIDDSIAIMLANALRHNLVLEYIKIRGENTDITETGWTALSKALCDTSSINAHTCQIIH